jgi:hypothetical protein|tara:strand:+ start:556 stop:762 length:207 start_codon:yes stop_codon:yes gene_type:complete
MNRDVTKSRKKAHKDMKSMGIDIVEKIEDNYIDSFFSDDEAYIDEDDTLLYSADIEYDDMDDGDFWLD